MADLDEFDARVRRLRDATEGLSPPPGFVPRVLAAASRRPAPQSWASAVLQIARWSLVPAAVASTVLLAASWSDQGLVEEAVVLGTVAGLWP